MRTLIIILIALVSIGNCAGQNSLSDRMKPLDEQKEVSPVKVKHRSPYNPVYNENLDDLCVKYRNIRTSGIVMTLLGGGALATGIIIHVSTNNRPGVNDGNDATYANKMNQSLHTGGDVAIALGAASMGVGMSCPSGVC